MKKFIKYKIAYVLTPITFGGSDKVSLNFLEHVDREKFDIEPIMFLRPWETGNFFEIEITRLKFKSFTIPVSSSIKGELLRVPRCLLKLKEIVGTRHYDLVHTHGYLADLLGLPAARASGVPAVSTCHGFILGGPKLSLYNKLDLLALGYFDKVIAVSDSIRTDWLMNKVRPERIKVIENSTSCSEYRAYPAKNISDVRKSKRKTAGAEPGEILLGYSGRLSREKGVADLICAVKMLTESGMSVKLVLLGDGAQRAELEELAATNRMTEKVYFAGFQTDVEDWLTAMDIFVLPSHTEGTPMALLEAMASGVPCIATAVGGIPSVIDSGINGILVSPGKPAEIRDAVRLLVSDRERSSCMAKNAQLKIEQKFNVHTWARSIEEEYVKTINA
ncbi:MAG: glycosyltransferase family 4 protein [Proteobacteria bacterium]|nr:glycosyltransferase family 4 protein [Pseudomonadota bacterium]